jgi:hypothetical protein
VSDVDQSITTGSSKDFGQFRVKEFSRFAGLWTTIGSLTLRIRTGASSGVFQVSSLMAVNSGTFVFDFPNYAQWAHLDITQAQSTVYTLLFQAEPLR